MATLADSADVNAEMNAGAEVTAHPLLYTRVPLPARPHVEYATIDTIRNFARASGDDNPLFGDARVAARSVRAGLLAPPLFPIATGSTAPGEPTSAPTGLDLVRDRHVRIREDHWRFGPFIRPGARVVRADTIVAVETVADDAIEITTRSIYSNGTTVHATHDRVRVHAIDARHPARGDRTKARYDPADLDEIDETANRWLRRGTTVRTADTVRVGDTIGPLVKGPLTVTDLVAYRGGVGAGPFDVEPLELARRNRNARPTFYDRTDTNAWDARERVHWDEAYAITFGHPSAYDYSHTRLVWASQLLTDWMSDAGRLVSISFARHHDNYVGDTQWLTARVDAVTSHPAGARITVAYRATNQFGTVTASGHAVVALPGDADGVA